MSQLLFGGAFRPAAEQAAGSGDNGVFGLATFLASLALVTGHSIRLCATGFITAPSLERASTTPSSGSLELK